MVTLSREYLADHLPQRPDDAHKGTMGTLCSITGSYGCAGAAVMSAKAALRSGVGLHCQVLPEAIYPIFASSVYESVCVPVKGSFVGTFSRADLPAVLDTVARASAVLIGCGMGNCADTRDVLHEVVRSCTVPLVIDADGINVLSAHIDILKERRCPLILTPHVKEFSRLTGLAVSEIAVRQQECAEAFAAQYPDVTLVLKSHRTVIVRGDRRYLNTAGNSGMAKGGSGDVLAGIIASLAAQGLDPLAAAASGVHIHALAGDLAAAKLGKTAMLPTDLIGILGEVFRSFEADKE